jgi:Domain of unknown function (DUF1963)
VDLPKELAHLDDVIERHLIPCLSANASAADEPLPALSTKLGGRPDLPPGTPWPTRDDGEPLALTLQCNFTDLAERFPGLLPWPNGGGLLQLFANGDDIGMKTLIHHDLSTLRPASPPDPDVLLDEWHLLWAAGRTTPDHRLDSPLWDVLYDLDGDQEEEADDVLEPFRPGEVQIGGSPGWDQDAAYWEALARDRGLFPSYDDENFTAKLQAAHEQASEEEALAQGWQLVFMLGDPYGSDCTFASDGHFYLMAPLDGTGRWDLGRLQVIYQCT